MDTGLLQELTTLGEAMIELPFTAARCFVDPSREREVQEVGWKAYDACIRVMNTATHQLYADPAFCSATGQTMQDGMRWHRMVSAGTGAFFGALWPAVGLPTAAEVTTLRAELRAMRSELSALRLEAEEARAAQEARTGAKLVKSVLFENRVNEPAVPVWDGHIKPIKQFSVPGEYHNATNS